MTKRQKLKAIEAAMIDTELLNLATLPDELSVLCQCLNKQHRKNNVQTVAGAKIVVDVFNKIKDIIKD